jgi:ribosome maturation factor RimP
MPFAYSKLHGLPADRLLAAIEPMLAAHGLEGVELIWKTDNRGWLLYLTVVRASQATSADPGAGVTLDDCSELSRDLSAALDVDDLIPGAYRLEVGTPGIERRLYSPADFTRFTSKLVKLKLHRPHVSEYTFRGYIVGVEGGDKAVIVVAKDRDTALEDAWRFEFENIASANLVLEWGSDARPNVARPKAPKSGTKGGASGGKAKDNSKQDVSRSETQSLGSAVEQHEHSDQAGSDESGADTGFDGAAVVATTQVKHGS